MAGFEEFFKNLFGRGPLAPTLTQTLLQIAAPATQSILLNSTNPLEGLEGWLH